MKTHHYLCAALLVSAMHASQAFALDLLFEPAAQHARPGDSVSLALRAGGLAANGPDSLGDFDVNVRFDQGALALVGYTLGDSLGDINLGEAVDFSLGETAPGLVNLAQASLLEPDLAGCIFCAGPYLDDIQPGEFVLATLTFDVAVLAPGERTLVEIANIAALGDGFGAPLDLDTSSVAEIVNPVPLPAAGILLASGLLLASATRLRKLRGR